MLTGQVKIAEGDEGKLAEAMRGLYHPDGPDMSQARLDRLCDEIRRTKMGQEIFEEIRRRGVGLGRFNVSCQFDAQLDPALGVAWSKGDYNSRLVFLSPWLTDGLLQTILVHELVHTLQGTEAGSFTSFNPSFKPTEEMFISRMREGEAFLFQTVFAMDKLKECNDVGPYHAHMRFMQDCLGGERAFTEFKTLCRNYLASKDEEKKEKWKSKIFWAIEKDGLDHYDSNYLKRFRDLIRAQSIVYDHFLLRGGLNGLQQADATREQVIGRLLEGMQSVPHRFCMSSEMGKLPAFLSDNGAMAIPDIIRKLEACMTPEARMQRDAEEKRIRDLIRGSNNNAPVNLTRQAAERAAPQLEKAPAPVIPAKAGIQRPR